MEGISFISCLLYVDSLRRIRKTINTRKKIETNKLLLIMHVLLVIAYFLSVIAKSISEGDYADSINKEDSVAKSDLLYRKSLAYYSLNIWLAFFC